MSHRKMTPRGQMSSSANSGPAIMMLPPHIRATFMPNPPLKHIPPTKLKRRQPLTGVSQFLVQFERTPAPTRRDNPTPRQLKEAKLKIKRREHELLLEPQIEAYRKSQKESGGEYEGMSCYNTLFVGRLAYEVTERKLLREMEVFGPVKDLKLIKDRDGKSRGYAFVEYDHEEDMKRAFRAADAMRIEGREIVVDVERGHTVPNWLPRRLGGGLGGTRCDYTCMTILCDADFARTHSSRCPCRLGGKDKNVTFPGRFDPSRPEASRPPPMGLGPPGPMGRGRGVPPPSYGYEGPGRPLHNDRFGEPPPSYGGPPPYGRGRGVGDRYGGPPRGREIGDRYGGPPPGRDWDRGHRPPPVDYERSDRKRYRSRSPERGQSRRRY